MCLRLTIAQNDLDKVCANFNQEVSLPAQKKKRKGEDKK